MNLRNYALLGLIAPLIAIFFVIVSILLSPWFSWQSNALSDLGHSVDSRVAPLFNFGLFLCGLLIILYSMTSFRSYAKYTSHFLALIGLSLQLVATFDEAYGVLHFLVSVLFFMTLGFASISYAVEKRSVLGLAALAIGSSSWILYWLEIYSSGIAVPEIVSSIATIAWVELSAIRVCFNRT